MIAKDRHVADIGAAIAGPTLRVASPIVVRGQSAGKVEAEVSLIPLLLQIGALTLLGIALGGAVFFGALLLPQRALREATAAHDEVQRDLRLQIEETQSALMVAKEATSAKSAFLAMMSHEIRTPMNAVMGLSSSLQESRLDTEQRHLVDTIYESSNGLLRLLNDILDFSKLDAGKIELETIAFSPAALLDHAVSIVAAKAAEKGLAIRAVTGPDLPAALVGDPARLQQVVLNLAVNAIKFTENGAIEVGARCLQQSADAATIECWVRDTGIGIAPEQIGGCSTSSRRPSSRPAAASAAPASALRSRKRIIERMQGDDRGRLDARRRLHLHVSRDAADDRRRRARQRGAAIRPKATSRRCCRALRARCMVLLAEDNGTNQLVFSKLMQGFDVDLTIAADGRQALEQARMEAFDIVFMDMRMPVMDGLEATRAIRALGGEWSRIPIVALTANAFPEDVRMCRDAGMNDFVAKPIRKKVLVERMAAMLADHPVVRAARGSSVATDADRPARERRTPVLAHEILDELTDAMGRDGVRAMFDGFVDETDRRLGLLRGLSCERDRERIREEAHTLKGAAGTCGLAQLAELAATLEQSAATMTSAKYADLVKRLDAGFAAGCAAFDRALGKVAA